jgi:hypothetical protein
MEFIADKEHILGTMVDLANLQDSGLKGFRQKWGKFYIGKFMESEQEDIREVYQRRDELRLLWNYLNKIKNIPQSLYEAYEAWDKAQPKTGPLPEWICNNWIRDGYMGLFITWGKRKRGIFSSKRELATVLALGFVEYADKMRYCQNPECLTPYFIAKRGIDKYCHPDCGASAIKASKRRWWNENRGKKAKKSANGNDGGA